MYFTWVAFLNHCSQIPSEEKQGCPFPRPDRKPQGCISYTKRQRRFNALLPQRVLLFRLRGSKSPFPRQSSSWAPLRAGELLQPPRNTRNSMGYQEKVVKLDKQVSAAHLKDLQIREKQQKKFQKQIKGGKKVHLVLFLGRAKVWGVWVWFTKVCSLPNISFPGAIE